MEFYEMSLGVEEPNPAMGTHPVQVVKDCDGAGCLPRTMGEVLPDGTVTGLCVFCQTFQPMTEVIPPSKPEWRREFRLAPHKVGA